MKPTHRLKVLNKTTGEKADLGAVWKNPDNTFNIVLNLCVELKPDKELVYTIFPVKLP
jgi:hypothetical protein